MTLQSIGKSFGANAIDSALCGGYFVLAEKWLGGDPTITMGKPGLIRFGMSAGSEFASDSVSRMVLPYITHMSSGLQSAEQMFLTPVVSGGIYVLADMLLKQDQHQSVMFKFLYQVGSSVLSGYTSAPVRTALGV